MLLVATIGVVVVGLDGRIVEANQSFAAMLGYSRAELLEMGPPQITAATHEQLELSYDALIAGQGPDESAEIYLLCKDGSMLLVEEHRQALRCGTDSIIVGVMRDITERKEAEKRLHHLAHYDALTGLPNRTLFHETLKNALSRVTKGGCMVAVLCIDVDYFKNVNDTLGHAIGDELLVQFGNRLRQQDPRCIARALRPEGPRCDCDRQHRHHDPSRRRIRS